MRDARWHLHKKNKTPTDRPTDVPITHNETERETRFNEEDRARWLLTILEEVGEAPPLAATIASEEEELNGNQKHRRVHC